MKGFFTISSRKKFDIFSAKCDEMLREISAICQLDHPRLIRYYDAWIEKPSCQTEDQTQDTMNERFSAIIYIPMQMCEYSLEEWLQSNQTPSSRSLSRMKSWFEQLVYAVAYLHKKGRIHRDLKPRNIFFVKDNSVKLKIPIVEHRKELFIENELKDATKLEEAQEQISPSSISIFESPLEKHGVNYMAPEQNSLIYSYKVDVFTLGLILIEICIPITKEQAKELFDNIRRGDSSTTILHNADAANVLICLIRKRFNNCQQRMFNFNPLFEGFVPELEKFLALMTNLDWTKRANCKELLNHPFLSNNDFSARDHLHLQSLSDSEPNMLPEDQETIRQEATMIEQTDTKQNPSEKKIADHGSDEHQIRRDDHYPREKRIVMGIDFGTTFTRVAYIANDRKVINVVFNAHGHDKTPSVVHYGSDITIVGERAEAMRVVDAKNTVFNVKRLMGRTADDPEIKMMKFPFEIIPSREGDANVRVFRTNDGKAGKEIVFSPEKICANILRYMKIIAEESIGEEVTEAVISVPAHFNNAQRQATKAAGEIAGFKVLRIINEPTAAALGYGFEMKRHEDSRTVLVLDHGGGTFDASIVKMSGAIVEVLSTRGLNSVGGHDFDCRIYEEAIARFREMGLDIGEDVRYNLLKSCELAKKHLSMMETAEIEVFDREAQRNFFTLTRQTFEEICEDLFEKIIRLVKEAIEDSGCEMSEIDGVLLIGGSSRILRVRELLKNLFGNKMYLSNAPDHAVARGAAILAASLTEDTEVKQFDVAPQAIFHRKDDNYRKNVDRDCESVSHRGQFDETGL